MRVFFFSTTFSSSQQCSSLYGDSFADLQVFHRNLLSPAACVWWLHCSRVATPRSQTFTPLSSSPFFSFFFFFTWSFFLPLISSVRLRRWQHEYGLASALLWMHIRTRTSTIGAHLVAVAHIFSLCMIAFFSFTYTHTHTWSLHLFSSKQAVSLHDLSGGALHPLFCSAEVK